MFDNLREQADSKPFYEEEAQFQQAAGTSSSQLSEPQGNSSGRILGMTGPQRFVIAVMLMFVICILGALALFITGKIGV